MKYLCLIYGDENQSLKMSEEEGERITREYFAYTDDIYKSGHMLGGNALQPTHAASTVRVRGGKVSITDGPFAETKDQLGGYYLIEAKDLNEAIQLASRIPGAKFGSVEVRPIQEFDRP